MLCIACSIDSKYSWIFVLNKSEFTSQFLPERCVLFTYSVDGKFNWNLVLNISVFTREFSPERCVVFACSIDKELTGASCYIVPYYDEDFT